MEHTSIEQLYQYYQAHPKVFIDTRKDIKDAIFFAVGQTNKEGVHRGNQFAEKAVESGKAAIAVINDPKLKEKHASDKRFVLVQNGEEALQALAQRHRKTLNFPILAIAGSNGKTTTKELLEAVLAFKFKTFATRGNLNNHLGVPLSLLSMNASYAFAILEIGANHLEETRQLAEWIQPDYGMVTNCGKDHLGEYGSVENVIKANKELYDVLAATQKTAFVCSNDPLLMDISSEVADRIIYGQAQAFDAAVLQTPFLALRISYQEKSIDIQTNLFGRFWLDTILNVAAIGHHFGVALPQIKEAIENYQPAALRSQLIDWQDNKVLLDCYNANPTSMKAFLTEIQTSNITTPKVLILGEMLELGPYEEEEHLRLFNQINVDDYVCIILIGDCFEVVPQLDAYANLQHFGDRDAAKTYLLEQQFANKYIFVKGSRSNRLESIFE